jgi:hypothetical protein
MTYVKSTVELGLKTDCQGIYIESNKPRIEAMISTGFLEFGVGDTREDSEYSTIASRMRGHESSKNLGWQHYLLDSIPTPGYRDYALHKEIRQTFAAQLEDPTTKKRNEVFRIAVEQYLIEEFVKSKDFEPIRIWLNEKIRKCAAKLNPNHEKQAVNLRNVQILVIKKVISALRQNGVVTNFVCELAARIGKTILFLELAKTMQEEFGHESMFIMAYGVGLSVRTSYKDEIGKYIDFAYLQFIDATEADAEEQYKQAIADGKMPVVFISLNPEVEAKYEWINKLAGTHIALLEETDFGTHTDSQVEKVDYILENKTVTRINASGTNIGRLAKAFGKNAIDEIISVPYCMVEQDPSIPNVVVRRFYNMLFNPKMNKLLEDFDKDVLPNINKILEKARSQEKFIAAVFQDLLGYQPIYGMNLSQAAGEIINHLMLFVNISKKSMEALAEIIETHCEEHKVLILNGDYTDNKEAEGLTKEELVRLQNGYYPGRDKLIVITNMMGTRSYSIPEIQACLFMQEGGDVYPYMQKYSRCLTPDEHGIKKFGHIFDFAFDQSKTRYSVMSVAVEAALLIRQKSKTYPEAVREVLNSVNIKDMVSGSWINAEEVIKQFEDNNKLLEIANSRSKMTLDDLINLAPNLVEALGELAKRSTSNKTEKSKIDKIIKTGKTFESSKTLTGRLKKNPLAVILDKAKRAINGSATTVLALSNYQGESFLECLGIIGNNVEMHKEFIELYGVNTETIEILAAEDCLPLPELDMIVKLSKYNNKQKHIENNALAILKDDLRLWFDIFGNRELKRFIKSKHCKKILVVAGGHGSEIDVLMDMFGVEILDKIVYNDKYSFLCNQIKRKYPTIEVVKGDFTELEFSMKFDVIVGNPPYGASDDNGRKDQANNLWSKFTKKGFDLLDKGGFLAFVTPNSWLSPAADIGKGKHGIRFFNDYFQYYKTHTLNINECGKHFNVGSTFSYFVVEKTPSDDFITQVITEDSNYKIDLKTINYLPKTMNPLSISINKKVLEIEEKFGIVGNNLPESRLTMQKEKTGKFIVPCYNTPAKGGTYWYAEQPISTAKDPKVIISISGTYVPVYDMGGMSFTGMCLAYYLRKNDNMDSIRSYLESKLVRFVLDENKYTGWVSPVISDLPCVDKTKIWTDIELYEFFNLTQEEINHIEANVK